MLIIYSQIFIDNLFFPVALKTNMEFFINYLINFQLFGYYQKLIHGSTLQTLLFYFNLIKSSFNFSLEV